MRILDRCAFVTMLCALLCVFSSFSGAPAADGPPRGRDLALCVGVNNYVLMGKLKYSVNDAYAIKARFDDAGTFRKVTLLTDVDRDGSPREAAFWPTGNMMLSHLEQLARAATPDDRIIFFFSGHGIEKDGVSCIVPVDGNESTAIPLDRLKEVLAKSRAGRKLLIIDACRSGGGVKGMAGIRKPLEEQSLGMLVSCGEDQFSFEDEASGHSLFTLVLSEALSGDADADGDGHITGAELHRYLDYGMGDYFLENDILASQTPEINEAALSMSFLDVNKALLSRREAERLEVEREKEAAARREQEAAREREAAASRQREEERRVAEEKAQKLARDKAAFDYAMSRGERYIGNGEWDLAVGAFRSALETPGFADDAVAQSRLTVATQALGREMEARQEEEAKKLAVKEREDVAKREADLAREEQMFIAALNKEGCETYLANYPNGRFASDIRARMHLYVFDIAGRWHATSYTEPHPHTGEYDMGMTYQATVSLENGRYIWRDVEGSYRGFGGYDINNTNWGDFVWPLSYSYGNGVLSITDHSDGVVRDYRKVGDDTFEWIRPNTSKHVIRKIGSR